MTLGDLSNAVLCETQQPGASFTVGGGGGPNWASVSNPQIGQGLVEFWLNEGYKREAGDLKGIQIAPTTFTFLSTAQTFRYAIPTAGCAAIAQVSRVFYKPFGQLYTREFRPGTELVSWARFQQYTAQGWLQPYGFGVLPVVASIDPTRTFLYFWKGSAIAGDTITVEYAAIPTQGATTGPNILINATDVPIFPADCHLPILYFALGRIFLRLREMALSLMYFNPAPQTPGLYQVEIKRIIDEYTKLSSGDTIRIEPFMDDLSMSSGPGY